MTVRRPVSHCYHDTSIHPLNATVQQFAAKNNNWLLTELPMLLTFMSVSSLSRLN